MVTADDGCNSHHTLQRRMLRAATWLLGSNIASQALRLISSLVLTRLLLPEAFGLMAAVQTLYFGLVMFSDLGVWQSVVNHPDGERPEFLGTAFAVQLLRGALLACIVCLIAVGLFWASLYAPFKVGTVYADPRLPWMVLVFAASALLQGAESMHIATAQRSLQTRLLTRLELLSQISGMVITIGAALMTRSVWSLLLGTLTATLTRTALSHTLLQGPTYRIAWDRASLRDIVGFGKWIFISSIIGFAAAHGEKVILGGALNAQSFGVFSIASLLLGAIIGLVGNLNAHLVFPSLSEALRQGEIQAQRVYARVQQIADGILAGIAGVTLVMGQWVVTLLYDDRYADAGWMLQWLGLGLLAMRYQVLEQMMFAANRPGWVTLSNLLRALALIVFVPLGYGWGGVQGAVGAVVASQFAGWPLAIAFKLKQGIMHWRSEIVWPLALLAGWLVGLLAELGARSLMY
jgi:O-antigen/teichoic acid export membrane protein